MRMSGGEMRRSGLLSIGVIIEAFSSVPCLDAPVVLDDVGDGFRLGASRGLDDRADLEVVVLEYGLDQA